MKLHLAAVLLALIALTSLATSQVKPTRVHVGQSVMSAEITNKVNPVYPPLARQARIQGVVLLKVQISKSGDVENLQLISGHPMLAPAAIAAVKQWKYKPYLLNGEPVAVETDVTVNFTLSDNPPAAGDAPDSVPPPQPYSVIGTVSSNPGDPAHPPKLVRVSSTVMQGYSVSKVQPVYPADAKEQHIQGEVRLDVTIDKEGRVSNLQLLSGNPALTPAAIEAVKQWKYRPYQINGNPVPMESLVVVNFTLAD